MPVPTLYDVCGFENGINPTAAAPAEFDTVAIGASASLTAVTTAVAGSNYALQASTGASSVTVYGERDWGANLATVSVFLMVRFNAVPAAITSFFSLYDSTPAAIADLRINASGNLAVYNYGNTTTYTSTGLAIRAGEWYMLELQMVSDAAAGKIDLKVWNVLEPGLSGITGINTLPGGQFRRWRAGVTAAQASAGARQIDNVIIADGWIGKGSVKTLWPGSAPANNWTTIDAGTIAWQCMKDIPFASAATHLIRSNTASQEQRFGLEPFASALGTAQILGLCPVIRHRRGVAGSAAATSIIMRSGATDGTAVVVDAGGTTYKTFRGTTHATDPATAAAWTLNGVNGAQLKLLHDAGTNSCDVNAAFVYVAYTRGTDGAVFDALNGPKTGRRFGQVPRAGSISDYEIGRGRVIR